MPRKHSRQNKNANKNRRNVFKEKKTPKTNLG